MNRINNVLASIGLLWLGQGQIFAQPNFDALMIDGINFDEKGDYTNAISTLGQAVGMQPQNDMAWLTRGIVRVHMSDFSSSVVDFNKAIYLNPNRPKSYLYRSLAYAQTSNFQFALSDVNQYLKFIPTDTNAHFQRMQLALNMGDLETAAFDILWVYQYLFCKKAGGEGFGDLNLMILPHYQNLKSFKEFEVVINQLTAIDSNDLELQLAKVNNLFQLMDYPRALKDIDAVIKKNGSQFSFLELKADILFYSGRLQESEVIYKQLFDLKPNDANLMADYGHCLLQLKRWEEADMWLTKSIKMKGNTPAYSYLGRGIARYNLGKIGIACADWERSLWLGEKNANQLLNAHCIETPKKFNQ